MRIGTWNLAGLWDHRRRALIESLDVDVWLFTEISEHTELPGFHSVWAEGEMAAERRWAAVFAREHLRALPQPHPATAAADLAGLTLWSSILPWRACGEQPPWRGADHTQRNRATLDALIAATPGRRLVWGGDWNHALEGREYAGSHDGRAALLDAVARFGLAVPTAPLGHHIPGLLSIDHIAIPVAWRCTARHVVAEVEETRLSDHDIYIIDAQPDAEALRKP